MVFAQITVVPMSYKLRLKSSRVLGKISGRFLRSVIVQVPMLNFRLPGGSKVIISVPGDFGVMVPIPRRFQSCIREGSRRFFRSVKPLCRFQFSSSGAFKGPELLFRFQWVFEKVPVGSLRFLVSRSGSQVYLHVF